MKSSYPTSSDPSSMMKMVNPCPMFWSKMEVVPGGRHCQGCNKVVVDFTGHSQEEIIAYFKKNGLGTCGKFSQDQLAPPPERSLAYRMKYGWLVILAFLGFHVSPIQAQEIETPTTSLLGNPNQLLTVESEVVEITGKEKVRRSFYRTRFYRIISFNWTRPKRTHWVGCPAF